jgi:hypothetical protein
MYNLPVQDHSFQKKIFDNELSNASYTKQRASLHLDEAYHEVCVAYNVVQI